MGRPFFDSCDLGRFSTQRNGARKRERRRAVSARARGRWAGGGAGARRAGRAGYSAGPMPELPEVETVCRVMRRALQGKRIVRVEIVRDSMFFSGAAPKTIESALLRRTVRDVGRHGKFFWLTLDG